MPSKINSNTQAGTKRRIIYGVILLSIAVVFIFSITWFFGSTEGIFNDEGSKIVIDHDGGADDAMAIFMALNYEKYFHGPKIVGITTVQGNVNESQVFINTQRILDIADRRDVPINRGCESSLLFTLPLDAYFGEDGLGDNELEPYIPTKAQPEHAALALIDLSKKYEGELVVVAIGALTNIALAVKLDPGFIGRLSQLYVGAGHIVKEAGDDYKPLPEFNALADVEAYHIVSNNSIADKVTVVPFSEITSTHNISREWRVNVLGALDTKMMKALNLFERTTIPLSETWSNLDPAVMAVVLNRTFIDDGVYSVNSIILCGDDRGLNTNEFLETKKEDSVYLVKTINEESYKQMLLDIFSADLTKMTKL